MKIIAYSNSGAVRDHNEDCYLIGDQVFFDGFEEIEANPSMLAVFDGVGGASCGEVASKIAAETLASQNPCENILECLISCNQMVELASLHQEQCRGMATTVAGIQIQEQNLTVFNMGDSRVYRFRKGMLVQLSYDHSYFNYLVSIGHLRMEDADAYKNNHRITNYLGQPSLENNPPYINTVDYGVKEEDIFLICTDGLTDMVEDIFIEKTMNQELSIYSMFMKLKTEAFLHGAKDNITMILLKI